MRNLSFSLFVPVVLVGASSLIACSFQAQVGDEPKHPHHPPPPATPAPAATPAAPATVYKHTGRPVPQPGAQPAPTPAPAGAQVVTATTPFGGNTQDPAGFKGSVYFIPVGSATIPNLSAMTPNGYVFTSTINVQTQAFTGGFPGIDPAHTTNFAIRYLAPLVVGTESDYDFRIVSRDGSVLSIDGTPIVDNNGTHGTPTSKDGPVHLVVGTHVIQLDYFETTGSTVALQLFCTKSGGSEMVCPTRLP